MSDAGLTAKLRAPAPAGWSASQEPETSMRQAFVGAVFLVSAAAIGWVVVPNAWQAWQMQDPASDPAALIDRNVSGDLTPQRLNAEIAAALAAEDDSLAASFVELAGEHELPVEPAQREQLAALQAGSAMRTLRDFGAGLAYGEGDSGAALAGAVTGDVTGFGDLRDLYTEGSKAAAGGSADYLVVGLAAAGLAVSAAAWSSAGAALPARSGLTLVKTTQKAGKLSKPLAASLSRAAAAALDRQALGLAVTAAGQLVLAAAWRAAARVLRPATLATFKTLGQDAATLYTRTGQRGARQALALAASGGEVTRAAKIAVAKGGKTRAILKLLGRGALVAAALSWTAAGWVFSFVWYLIGLAMLARRFGLWLGRKLSGMRGRTAAPARRRTGRFPRKTNDAPLLGA